MKSKTSFVLSCAAAMVAGAGLVGGAVAALVALPSAQAQQSALRVGGTYYVQGEGVNVRSFAGISASNKLGVLGTNDVVRVIGIEGEFAQVQVIETLSSLPSSSAYFVSTKFLGANRVAFSQGGDPNRFFAIQNIATERTRIYERCTESPDCKHKLVFETDMAVGDTGKGLTRVGQYKINKWVKFYQDGAGHYPSWYAPGYPPVPQPWTGSPTEWVNSKYMPGGRGDGRGAFGWYTALVGPDADSQWMHGTFGWGAEGGRYIRLTRDGILNAVSDPRSKGCTRMENQAIAFVRQILPVGSQIFRIYAMEGVRDLESNARNRTPKQKWSWILTKTGAQKDGLRADRAEVLAAGVSPSEVIEEGVYDVDTHPDPVPYKWVLFGRGSTDTGDIYDLGKKAFQGVFLVDEGRLFDYEHPRKMTVGGMKGALPTFIQTTDGRHEKPEPQY